MNISDQELRAMVRDAIARADRAQLAPSPSVPPAFRTHASHAMLSLVTGGDADGQCLIEPAVPCNHCGFCRSLGH
jgi:hypothetical protein